MAVALEGHVGRAARNLHIAQPAISRQIRRLEDELGTALFVRTPRGMSLSGAGEVFLEHARMVLDSVDAARNAVRSTAAVTAAATSARRKLTTPRGG